ncbi:hypothetical protein [Ensifer sp. SL37]|uniref:hypothetical protein n=1 Tax=Ensifer sp. SL37 TaxID=2995137 RepID=UPI00227310CC|nr:hypothetical protein [Ensifer sp. SL37]MCY1740896.1 hypothetical protein [Ensifer sp. SL37]
MAQRPFSAMETGQFGALRPTTVKFVYFDQSNLAAIVSAVDAAVRPVSPLRRIS